MSLDPFKIFQVNDITYHCIFSGYKEQQHGKVFKLNAIKRFKVFYENEAKQLIPVTDMDFRVRNYQDLFGLIVSVVHPSVSQQLSKKQDPSPTPG